MGFVFGCLFTLYRVRKAKEHMRQHLRGWNNENNV